MHPIRQRFQHLRQRTAAATRLSRLVGRNCHHRHTSFFRFVRQDMQERTPRDIPRGFGKPTAGNAAHVQIFVNDCAVARDQRTRRLVVEIPSPIADPLLLFLQRMDGFCPARTAFLPPCNLPLCSPQRRLRLPIGVWRRNALAFRRDQEGFQTKIDPHGRPVCRRGVDVTQVARTHDVPTISLPLVGDRLDLPLDWTMQLDVHAPDVLEGDAAPIKPTTVAHGRKLDRSKAVPALEARVARCLARLDTPEERLKRPIQPPQGRLTTGKVGRRQEAIGFACGLQLSRRFAIGHAALLLFPRLFACRKGIIVEPPMRFQHGAHRAVLLTVVELMC